MVWHRCKYATTSSKCPSRPDGRQGNRWLGPRNSYEKLAQEVALTTPGVLPGGLPVMTISETPGAAIGPGQIVLSGRSGSSAHVDRRLDPFIGDVRLGPRYQQMQLGLDGDLDCMFER